MLVQAPTMHCTRTSTGLTDGVLARLSRHLFVQSTTIVTSIRVTVGFRSRLTHKTCLTDRRSLGLPAVRALRSSASLSRHRVQTFKVLTCTASDASVTRIYDLGVERRRRNSEKSKLGIKCFCVYLFYDRLQDSFLETVGPKY